VRKGREIWKIGKIGKVRKLGKVGKVRKLSKVRKLDLTLSSVGPLIIANLIQSHANQYQ